MIACDKCDKWFHWCVCSINTTLWMLSYVHIAFNNHYRECMDLIEAPEGDWKCDGCNNENKERSSLDDTAIPKQHSKNDKGNDLAILSM